MNTARKLYRLGLPIGAAALLLVLTWTILSTSHVLADSGDIAFQGFEGSDSWSYVAVPDPYGGIPGDM